MDDYVAALERGDATRPRPRAPGAARGRCRAAAAHGARDAVEEAIFVQANNRLFGVVFWFMVLGPAGAWLFRVSDLLRRRAAFEAARRAARGCRGDLGARARRAARRAGLDSGAAAALSYALAGSFEDAVGNWQVAVDGGRPASVLDRSEDLLARVGRGSLQPAWPSVPPEALDAATARGRGASSRAALWIWLAAIALLVLVGVASREAAGVAARVRRCCCAASAAAAAARPRRIVSLAPNLTEIAFAAGAGARWSAPSNTATIRRRRARCRASAMRGASTSSACWRCSRTSCSSGRPARRAPSIERLRALGLKSSSCRRIASPTCRRRCAASARSPGTRATAEPAAHRLRARARSACARACGAPLLRCSSRSTTSRCTR